MHHALIAIRAHRDLAKFDLEDGLLRSIVARRMTEPSSISRIVVDLPTEDQTAAAGSIEVDSDDPIDALVWLSADEVTDLDPRSLPTPLDEVAASLAGWMIESTELRDLDGNWVGTATPGLKLVFLLTQSPELSADDFEAWLRDTAETCSSRMVSGGLSYHRMMAPMLPSPSVDGAFAFWFPTAARLEEAEAFGVFDPVRTAGSVDHASTRRLVTVEHRLVPNPNLWPVDHQDPTPRP